MGPSRALLASVLLVLALLGASGGAEDGPRWLADSDEAFALARETGRPILAVFR